MMRIENITFQYKHFSEVLKNISFEVNKGEIIAVLGNNGAGKSTLLKCLNSILLPQKGCVYIGEDNIFFMSRTKIAKQLAFLTQEIQNAHMSVYDIIMLGRRPYIKWGIGKKDILIVEKTIAELDLEDIAFSFFDEISGGQKQKVMIARALVQEPGVLLLDEPTSNLDLKNKLETFELLKKICNKKQIAVIVVLHDINLALRFGDKFILLKDNKIYSYGDIDSINPKAIKDVYDIDVLVQDINDRKIVIPL